MHAYFVHSLFNAVWFYYCCMFCFMTSIHFTQDIPPCTAQIKMACFTKYEQRPPPHNIADNGDSGCPSVVFYTEKNKKHGHYDTCQQQKSNNTKTHDLGTRCGHHPLEKKNGDFEPTPGTLCQRQPNNAQSPNLLSSSFQVRDNKRYNRKGVHPLLG